MSGSWGSSIGASFFRQVYEDLRTYKRSKYAASSASEFERFEAEYRKRAKAHAERQAQAMAEEREAYERRTRANFDGLGYELPHSERKWYYIKLCRVS